MAITSQAHAGTPRKGGLLQHRELPLLGVLVGLLIAFSLFSDRFATIDNLGQIATDMSIVLIVSLGQALVLFTKNIDVSVGSMVGLTAFFAGWFTSQNPDLPLIIPIIASCLLGLLLGAINGALVGSLQVPSIMVTLGTLYVFRGIDSALAGSQQITAQNLPENYAAIASWSLFGVPGIFIYAIGIALAAWIFTQHTYTGRTMLAAGSSPLSAAKLGLPVKRLVLGAYCASGALSGFAGVLWGARYGTVDSGVAVGFEMVVLAAVIVGGVSMTGGVGTIPGVFIGAGILSVIAVGLALLNVSAFWLQAIQGTVIVLAILFDYFLRRRLDKTGAPS